MEQNLPVVAKKLWSLIRVMLFMLRKNISKRKLLLDLNLMMKRGKVAGKALQNLILHHHRNWSSSNSNRRSHDSPNFTFPPPKTDEYEFSCSNSPAYPLSLFSTNKKRHYKKKSAAQNNAHDEIIIDAAVIKALHEMLNSATASPALPGFGKSPRETGKSKDSRVRTSSGTFLARGRDKTIRTIEKRLADFTFLPVEHGEGLQVLHYEVGQRYEPHYDYFQDEYNTRNGGQRMATVLMYLSDVEEGGETVFPSAKGNISAVPWWNELSECGKEGLSVKPKMGDALLFWSMRPDASLDPSSLHGGCPVINGNKWSSTKWIRVNEYKA